MLTITRMARSCGVSRTTVLYYEQARLLAPSARSAAGYRLYAPEDLERLRMVCDYRAAGLPVAAIKCLLDGASRLPVVADRLRAIQAEMAQLREQQAVLVRLIGGEGGVGGEAATQGPMDKAAWTALFRASGMDDTAMLRWHALFEKHNPAGHAAFLASLGIGQEEAARIRAGG